MSVRILTALVVVPLLLSGCASYRNYNRGESCEKAIKDYSKMVRWLELEKAAISVADKGQRDAYAQAAESIRRRGITMVDVRLLAQECRPERGTAEAAAEYDYFVMPDNRLRTVTDRQKWVYRQDEADEQVPGWKLTSPPPVFK